MEEKSLTQAAERLSDTLTELRTISETLKTFDGTEAASTLGSEVARLRRQLDLISETIAIVVQHLPSAVKIDHN